MEVLSASLVGVCEGHTDRVWDAEWSTDGERLVSVSGDHSIRVWRRQKNASAVKSEKDYFTCEISLGEAHEKTVRHCCFHPKDACFACASFDGTVSIWDAAAAAQSGARDWTVSSTLEGHENEVKGVAWSRNGNYLATCGRDKTVWVWAVSGGAGSDREYDCLAVLRSHTQDVKNVWWSKTEDVLFSSSYDDTVRVWRAGKDEEEWSCSGVLEGHSSTVWSGTCAPAKVNGPDSPVDELVTCSDDSTVMFWSHKRGAPDNTWVADQVIAGAFDGRPVYGVAWSDDDRVACAAGDNSVKVYSRVKGTRKFNVVLALEGAHDADINSVAWCPVLEEDGSRLIATAGDDNVVKIWKITVAESK